MESNPRRLPEDERKKVTVKTVVELASEQNPSEITTAAIAKRMNLTQGALFRHFPNKEAIWQSVMEWVSERLLARIDTAAKTAGSPLAALEAIFMTHIEFVTMHPGVPRMLFGELQRPKDTITKRMVRTLISHYGERICAVIEDGKTMGEIAKETDTSAAATLFIGMIQGLVMQSLLVGDIKRMRDEAPGVFATYLNGIGRTK